MSGRKFSFRGFASLNRKLENASRWAYGTNNTGIPVDFKEFNQIYFSSRPVLVEVPSTSIQQGLSMVSKLAAMRLAFDHRNVQAISNIDGAINFQTEIYHNALVPKSRQKGKFYVDIFNNKREINFDHADDWMFIMYFSAFKDNLYYDDTRAKVDRFMDMVVSTDGFRTGSFSPPATPKFYGELPPPRKKVVIVWDTDMFKESLDFLKREYRKRFVFVEYGREKGLVDNWFKDNETMLDPRFDILLMYPGLDVRKVLLYAATNHLYQFREWGRFNPEVLERHFSKDVIKEMLGGLPRR